MLGGAATLQNILSVSYKFKPMYAIQFSNPALRHLSRRKWSLYS